MQEVVFVRKIILILILLLSLFGCSDSSISDIDSTGEKVIADDNSPTNADSSTSEEDSFFRTVATIDIINGYETQVLNGKIIYQGKDNRYLFDPFTDYQQTIPTEISNSRFLQITDDTTISLQYDYDRETIIVYDWNYKNGELADKAYQLENFSSLEFLDAIYFNGDIFVAFDGGIIIKINDTVEYHKLLDIGFDIINLNDFLIVNNDKLYAIAARNNIYTFNNIKNQFDRIEPSPVLVDSESYYYMENGNSIKAINGQYSAEFTLPQLPEDTSLHHENSYYVIDSYKDRFLVIRWSLPNGSLYAYYNGKIIEIPIVENDLPIAKFINKNQLVYSDENNLYLYDLATLEKTLVIENTSPLRIEQINSDEANNYYLLIGDSTLEILEAKK